MAGAQPGLAPGPCLPASAQPSPLYLDPGLCARLTPEGRHAFLSSLQRTGWGGRPGLRLTGPTQGGHISSPGSLAKACILWPGEGCALHNTEPPGASSRTLCKHPGHSGPGRARAGCPGALRLPGSSWARSGWQPRKGCSGGVPPRTPHCPPWQQCLQVNTGIPIQVTLPPPHKSFLTSASHQAREVTAVITPFYRARTLGPSEAQGLAQVALLLSGGLGLPSSKSLLWVTTLTVTQLLPHTPPTSPAPAGQGYPEP